MINRINLITVLFCILLSACSQENDGNEPVDGMCSVSLHVSNLPDFKEATTRALPRNRNYDWQTLDASSREVSVSGSDETLQLTSYLRMEYDEQAVGASTRAFNPANLFGANSKFRMLVFKASDMDKPIKNMVCQVNATGNGAKFLSPATDLSLPVGSYVFVCFPDPNGTRNPWAVGQSASATNCHLITLAQDEDFLCLKTGTVSLSTAAYSLDLSTFTRYGFQFTMNFKMDSGTGYLTAPTGQIPLTVSDNGSTNRIFNTSATFNLRDKAISNIGGNHSLTDNIKINGSGSGMTYTGFTYYLIANPSATNKLTIQYPAFSVQTPDKGVKTIPAGTLTTGAAISIPAGMAYTFTFGISGDWIMVGGVKWAKGNLRYLGGGKYAQAKLPNDPTATVKEVRGDFFRWGYTLPQSASNTSSDYPNVTWSVTTPNWNGEGDLGNYNYYKGIIGDTYTKAPSSNPTATETGDPCKGLGSKWRMPTYNELMLLVYTPGSTALSGSTSLTTARNYLKNNILSSGNDGNVWNDTSTDAAKKQRGIYIAKSGLRENPSAPGSYSAYNASQHLFLPVAGGSDGGNVNNSGYNGFYWCSTPSSGFNNSSWGVYFYSGDFYLYVSYYRYSGLSVRCVSE